MARPIPDCALRAAGGLVGAGKRPQTGGDGCEQQRIRPRPVSLGLQQQGRRKESCGREGRLGRKQGKPDFVDREYGHHGCQHRGQAIGRYAIVLRTLCDGGRRSLQPVREHGLFVARLVLEPDV
jgi:hypothetical protein